MFDMLSLSHDVWEELRCILESTSIIKAVHDCRQDSAAMLFQAHIEVRSVFDTQASCLHIYCMERHCTV